MRAMSAAAVKAGLIDGSKTSQEREAALFKLMEQGKLISSDILPHFGKELSNLANNGGELTTYLEKGLSPQLGRARNNLVELQNEMAKGMRPATVNLLNGFNDLSKEGNNLAFFLGKVLGGAMVTLGLIVRLPVAAFMDLSYWISDTLGLSKEQTDAFIGLAGSTLGVALSIWAIRKAVLGLATAYGVLKAAKAALGALAGVDGDGKGGKGKGGRINLGKATGKGVMRAGGNLAKNAARFINPYVAAAATSYMASGMINDSLSNFDWYRNADEKFTKMLHDMTGLDYFGTDAYWKSKEQQGKIDINLNLNTNGLDGIIEAKVDKAQGNMLENAYMNIQSGGVR